MDTENIKVGDIVKFCDGYLKINGYEEEDMRFLVLDVQDATNASFYKDLLVQVVAPVDCRTCGSIWWEDDIDLILA
jgi:hypothetical protein